MPENEKPPTVRVDSFYMIKYLKSEKIILLFSHKQHMLFYIIFASGTFVRDNRMIPAKKVFVAIRAIKEKKIRYQK